MSDRTTWRCDKHDTENQRGEPCAPCLTAFAGRRDATMMTPQERADEFRWWGGTLTIPLGLLRQRIEELVGRGVWTHELANPQALVAEILSGESASLSDVLSKIPGDKPLIVVVTEGGDAS